MDRRYREELEQVRLTEESKRELVRALEARRELAAEGTGQKDALLEPYRRGGGRPDRRAGVVGGGGGDRLPVLRSYFGDSAAYQQSAAELGQSVTKDGWTVTLTDCVGDDRNLWFGLEIAGPEGTVLDAENYYIDWYECQFPGLYSFLPQ
ncbi:MAG: DUF4179 domain-containing protein [Flavonifractor plautii]